MQKRIHILFILVLVLMTGLPLNPCFAAKEKLKIKEVVFLNNESYNDHSLHKVMLNRPSTMFLPVYYLESSFAEDLRQIEDFYHRNGFLYALVEDYNVRIDSLKSAVNIEITINEGPLTTIEGISVFGNSAFPDSVLKELINIKKDSPLQQKKLDKTVSRLVNYFANHGFIEARIQTEVDVNSTTNRAVIDYFITENSQFSIGNILINGLKFNKENVVKRELLFNSGDTINYSNIIKSQRQLYLTGLFQSVFINPVSSSEQNKKDVLIEVKENPHREFAVSVGYGSIEKIRGGAEVSNISIFGTARKAGLNGKLSFMERSIEATFSEPRTLGTLWKTDISLKAEFLDMVGYDIYQNTAVLSVSRKILSKTRVITSFRTGDNTLKNIRLDEVPFEAKSQIKSVRNAIIYDSRDNLFNTYKGAYVEFASELAELNYNGINYFSRTTFKAKKYISKEKTFTFATSLDLGIMNARKEELGDVPLNEKFYVGGPNSIRGFSYQKVGPLNEDRIPLGGRFKVVFNVFELRQKLYKILSGVIFTDVGNVWEEPKDIAFNSLRYSPGIGLRVNTVIGLGRLDFGFNPSRKANESAFMVYFSIGQAF